MQLSHDGAYFLSQQEGIRYRPYKDSRGLLTIGIGHLIKPGESFTILTQQQVFDLFAQDCQSRVAFLNECLNGIPVTQNQFDALFSFMYNIGNNGFENSQVLAKLEDGDIQGAGAAFMGWSRPPEIIPRRKREMNLFLNGTY